MALYWSRIGCLLIGCFVGTYLRKYVDMSCYVRRIGLGRAWYCLFVGLPVSTYCRVRGSENLYGT